MNLQELQTEYGRLDNESNAILKKAVDEKRADLNQEEDAKFSAVHADMGKLRRQIERFNLQNDATAFLERSQGRKTEHNQSDTRSSSSAGQLTDRDRGEAVRAWMCAGAPATPVTAEQRAIAARCGISLESKALTVRLGPAMKASRPTVSGFSASEEDIRTWSAKYAEERAALTGAQSTTTTGGNTVADEAMRALEIALLQSGGMRSIATVLRTATGGPLPIPTTNDTANKGEIIAENTTATELEMTFGQLVIDAYKYTSKYILASIEFLQDTSINANEFLGSALGTRIARITNDHFTTGTGVGQPKGIVAGAVTSGVTTAANGTITYDNLVDLEHSIDPAYRVNGRFMMHDSALKIVKKLKALQYSGDTTGTPLWVPGLASGAPDTILGYPYVINQSLAPIGAGSKSIVFGQLDKYLIRDVRDVTLLRLDEMFALLGQVAFLAISRHDGDLLDAGTNPVKFLTQGA